MFRSYFKVAFRSLKKNKLISFINIFGLGLSMTIGIMIMIRLQDQLSYDNFHPDSENTYRILTDYRKKRVSTGRWQVLHCPFETGFQLI
ncbi:MAG: hypothetical protein ABWZ25_12125 [Chitinophagaceae bacterium]